jgi:hypothetical protein
MLFTREADARGDRHAHSAAGELPDPQRGALAQVRTVEARIDGKRRCQSSRAAREIGELRAAPPASHPFDAFERFERANENRRTDTAPLG